MKWVAAAAAALLLAGCGPKREISPDSGRDLYMSRCAMCHGANGEGTHNLYPPLNGSAYMKGPPVRMAAIILDGMQGPVGRFNATMPGWRANLSDAEIAAIMTWLRKAPITPVEVSEVRVRTQARGAFWTARELDSLSGR